MSDTVQYKITLEIQSMMRQLTDNERMECDLNIEPHWEVPELIVDAMNLFPAMTKTLHKFCFFKKASIEACKYRYKMLFEYDDVDPNNSLPLFGMAYAVVSGREMTDNITGNGLLDIETFSFFTYTALMMKVVDVEHEVIDWRYCGFPECSKKKGRPKKPYTLDLTETKDKKLDNVPALDEFLLEQMKAWKK